MIKSLLGLLGALLLGGCHLCAMAEDYKWTLKAPPAVVLAPHSRLHFSVETTAADGRPIAEVPYVWTIDWVGLRGVEHGGRSFREESNLVKGEPGPAVLRVLACDRYDRLIEVAQATVQVSWPQP